MELLGLGRDAIRLVPSDDAYRMRLDSLARMIAEDRDRGFRPVAVVAAAGTVGTGAVDPSGAIVVLEPRNWNDRRARPEWCPLSRTTARSAGSRVRTTPWPPY